MLLNTGKRAQSHNDFVCDDSFWSHGLCILGNDLASKSILIEIYLWFSQAPDSLKHGKGITTHQQVSNKKIPSLPEAIVKVQKDSFSILFSFL